MPQQTSVCMCAPLSTLTLLKKRRTDIVAPSTTMESWRHQRIMFSPSQRSKDSRAATLIYRLETTNTAATTRTGGPIPRVSSCPVLARFPPTPTHRLCTPRPPSLRATELRPLQRTRGSQRAVREGVVGPGSPPDGCASSRAPCPPVRGVGLPPADDCPPGLYVAGGLPSFRGFVRISHVVSWS